MYERVAKCRTVSRPACAVCSLFSPDYWPVWLVVAGLMLVGMWLVLALHAMLRFRAAHKTSAGHGEKVYLYSKAVRLWHWSNALLFLLLLVSGPVNHFSAVSAPVMKSLLTVHEVCGFLLLACWVGFVLINLIGGNGHHYIIQRQGWIARAQRQTRFYLFGIMQGESHPFPASPRSKFNPLQQAAYVGVMYGLLPLLLISGLLSLYPTVVGDLFLVCVTGCFRRTLRWQLSVCFSFLGIFIFALRAARRAKPSSVWWMATTGIKR